mmetsp:Transcript_62299/g.146207  ORF Transcript_62299/g.146207 Transcript_62299/m.146207 type:complete len:240 (-) Transcript_62299:452-1171(-)
MCPLAPDHGPCCGRHGNQELNEETEEEKAGESCVLDEIPGSLDMRTAGGAMPGFRGLRDTEHCCRDDEDDKEQANGHQAAEGQAPVEGTQVGLAVHEDANDQRGGQRTGRADHGHFRLDLSAALHRLTLGVLQEEGLAIDTPHLETCCEDEHGEDIPVLLLMDPRVARRHVPVVVAGLVLAVEGSRLGLQAHGKEGEGRDGPGDQKPRLPLLPADGEAVRDHAIGEKEDIWELHKCCDG